jgi:tetratricopeptide (TPR) repeat protein
VKRFATLCLTCLVVVTGFGLFAHVPKAAGVEGPGDSPAVTDSLGLLEREVARDSSDFDALFRLGVMYLDRDRYGYALKVLNKANKLKPKHVPTLVNLGAAYDASNAPDQAQAYYKKALALEPDDSVARCRMASSIYSQGNYGEAIDMLRQVIDRDSTSYCAYFTLGVAFADAGIYRDAIRAWKKVVTFGPGTPEAASAMESIDVLERFIGR